MSFTKFNPRISICQFQISWWPCIYPLTHLAGLYLARDVQIGLYFVFFSGYLISLPNITRIEKIMVVFQLTHVILSITVPKYPNLGVSNTTVLTYNSGQQKYAIGLSGVENKLLERQHHWMLQKQVFSCLFQLQVPQMLPVFYGSE